MALPIHVWSFDSAPTVLTELSEGMGDELWIAEVPPEADLSALDYLTPKKRLVEYAHPHRSTWRVLIAHPV